MTADTDRVARYINQVIGCNLRRLRAEHGESQKAAGRRIGVAPSMLAFAEIGTRGLVSGTFTKIVAGYAIRPAALLTEHPDIPCPHCASSPPAGWTCNMCRKRGPDRELVVPGEITPGT